MTLQQANIIAILTEVVDKISPEVKQVGAEWIVEAKNLETGAVTTLEHVGHLLDMLSIVFKKAPAPTTLKAEEVTSNAATN